jgi:hypothetical protein
MEIVPLNQPKHLPDLVRLGLSADVLKRQKSANPTFCTSPRESRARSVRGFIRHVAQRFAAGQRSDRLDTSRFFVTRRSRKSS